MNQQELLKQRNSDLSIILIVFILICIFICINIGNEKDERLSFENILYLSGCLNVLLVFYVLTYREKKYVAGKILFIFLSIINILFFGLLWISSKSFHP